MDVKLPAIALIALLMAACSPAPTTSPAAPAPGASTATAASAATGSASAGSSTAAGSLTGCVDGGDDVGELTGVWDVDDDGTYYLRQIGDCVWWFGTSLQEVGEGNQEGFANVAVGTVVGDEIRFDWADVPLGGILGGGTLTLAISSDGDELIKVGETGTGFGGMVWRRHEPASSPSPSGEASGTPTASSTAAASSTP